jgi:hypothetical protein
VRHKNSSHDEIIISTTRPTNGQSVELRNSLRGLALFLGKLVLELLLFGGRRLTDLLELLLKVGNLSLLLHRIL